MLQTAWWLDQKVGDKTLHNGGKGKTSLFLIQKHVLFKGLFQGVCLFIL